MGCARDPSHAGGYIEFADEIEAVVRIFHMRHQGFVWTPGIYITPAWIRASGWKDILTGWITYILKM